MHGRWSPRARIGVLAVAAVNVLVLAVLSAKVAHTSTPLHIDELAWRALRSARLRELIPDRLTTDPYYSRMTRVGSPGAVMLCSGVLGLWALLRRDARGAALCLLGPGIAGVVTEAVLKPSIGRAIGAGHGWLFPSGHVTGAAAVATLVVVLVARYHGARWAAAVAPAVAVLPVLASVGAVGHRWHYLTDTVGGVAVGVSVVLLIAAALFGNQQQRAADSGAVPQPSVSASARTA